MYYSAQVWQLLLELRFVSPGRKALMFSYIYCCCFFLNNVLHVSRVVSDSMCRDIVYSHVYYGQTTD